MLISKIFDVFSRRKVSGAHADAKIPNTTRTRVILWCSDLFRDRDTRFGSTEYLNQFWEEIHATFQMRLGRPVLSLARFQAANRTDDVIQFLQSCESEEFLDFLEYIFRIDSFHHAIRQDDQIVDELNELLAVDDLPYYLTKFVREEKRERIESRGGQEHIVTRTLAYPTVICKDNEVMHVTVIKPTLTLIQSPLFKNSNSEYLEALEHYRRSEFGDSLVKCGSAFESAMKVICHSKRWSFQETDTASALIKTIIQNTNLEGYMEQTLMIVATLRNRLSKAHGAGITDKKVARHIAAYALNSTAAAILLLSSEAGLD